MNAENRGIKNILPQRYPFLFIDRILESIPGEKLICLKNITYNEPQFTGHFPEYAVMPGVLIIEAAAQAGILFFNYAANKSDLTKREYLLSSIKSSFKKPVVPGDQLILTVTPVKLIAEAGMVKVECTVDGEVAAKCDLTFSAKINQK